MESVLSLKLVILDESGELRTPPNQTYTDEELESLRFAMMTQLQEMAHKGIPLSPMFESLLVRWAEKIDKEDEMLMSEEAMSMASE